MPLSPGARFGPYNVFARIGEGGMGEVYRATDTRLGREVALKTLPTALIHDQARVSRFRREAQVLAALNHPHIAAIYGLEEFDGSQVLVLELVNGESLDRRIARGPIPAKEALDIGRQIAEALEAAHEKGIVHRDLKPANIALDPNGNVKVLDFGLAKATSPSTDPLPGISDSPTETSPGVMTAAGVVLGTAAYMSPEQSRGKSVDHRADVWAFGCVLYEILTGERAFRGDSVADTLAAVVRSDPDWSRLSSTVPPGARALVRRCLRKEPTARLQAIGDARIALEEILAGGSGEDERCPASAPPASVLPRRLALSWTGFGVTALALAASVWIFGRAPKGAPLESTTLQILLTASQPLQLSGLFALSPNGRQLAFAAAGKDGVPRIWVRDLGSLRIGPLPASDGIDSMLFWSPDSRVIAFTTGGKLKKMVVSGGPAETVCALARRGVGGSWNRDGDIIFGQFGGPIVRVSAASGVAAPLTVLDGARGDVAHTNPVFLPDGRHFLYYRDASTSGFVSVGSLDVEPPQQDPRRIIESQSGPAYVPAPGDGPGHLLFRRESTLMAQPFDARRLSLLGQPARVIEEPIGLFFDSGLFSASPGTLVYWPRTSVETQLTWFDAQGKVLGTVGEPGPAVQVWLSPDGARALLARTMVDESTSLWVSELSRGTVTRFALDSSADYPSAVWSPDGRSVIFGSARPGQMADIYRKGLADPGEPELLLKTADWKMPLSWSRDGRFLLYVNEGGSTKRDVWVLPLQAPREPEPFLRTQFDESDASFSPEGRWVAYASDESGRSEVYVRAFPSRGSGASRLDAGSKVLVSDTGGFEPQWRDDGRVLYYRHPDGKLMAVDVTGGAVFGASVPRALFQPPPGAGAWAPFPDGKRFLFLVPVNRGDPAFTVVLNWQASLR